MVTGILTGLKVPENIQNRVFEYYELRNDNKYIRNDKFYEYLNENLKKIIVLF